MPKAPIEVSNVDQSLQKETVPAQLPSVSFIQRNARRILFLTLGVAIGGPIVLAETAVNKFIPEVNIMWGFAKALDSMGMPVLSNDLRMKQRFEEIIGRCETAVPGNIDVEQEKTVESVNAYRAVNGNNGGLKGVIRRLPELAMGHDDTFSCGRSWDRGGEVVDRPEEVVTCVVRNKKNEHKDIDGIKLVFDAVQGKMEGVKILGPEGWSTELRPGRYDIVNNHDWQSMKARVDGLIDHMGCNGSSTCRITVKNDKVEVEK